MFESIETAAPDAILGLTEAFRKDTNPQKINLGVGVFQDEHGKTPLLKSVKEAERRILDVEKTKTYVTPNNGTAEYVACVQRLLFGSDHPTVTSGRAVSAHAPGGTGALRLAGDYLKQNHSESTLWMSDPTWANHRAIFAAAGVPTQSYPYYDAASRGLAFDRMLEGLREVPARDVVLLHACCHNPTGVDPEPGQWEAIAGVLADRGCVPLLDFAYQGFGTGLDDDASGFRILAERLPELMVCSSFSKNFGLYCERVGALTVVSATAEVSQAVLSQIKLCIRRSYSNPPAHGAAVVSTVLDAPELRRSWESELEQMRDRINGMRRRFAESLDARGVKLSPSGNAFVVQQKGMFSFSGLDKEQVHRLRDEFSIYLVGDGRINVAGMTEANMDRLCDAIATVA